MHRQSKKKILYLFSSCETREKIFFAMTSDVILMTYLTSFQYALLHLIKDIREQLKQAQKRDNRDTGEPVFTLQQNYIVSLFQCSPNTVVSAIDRLCELRILEEISTKFGACALYRYSPSVCNNLIKRASKQQVTLITGRAKTKQSVSADKVIKYIIGKSIQKAQ